VGGTILPEKKEGIKIRRGNLASWRGGESAKNLKKEREGRVMGNSTVGKRGEVDFLMGEDFILEGIRWEILHGDSR